MMNYLYIGGTIVVVIIVLVFARKLMIHTVDEAIDEGGEGDNNE